MVFLTPFFFIIKTKAIKANAQFSYEVKKAMKSLFKEKPTLKTQTVVKIQYWKSTYSLQRSTYKTLVQLDTLL